MDTTEVLRKEGYWSWPGSSFDAERHQRGYHARLLEIARKLGTQVVLDKKPIHDEAGVTSLLSSLKTSKPDALLLMPFYKGYWSYVAKIVEQAQVPTVVFATRAVLFIDHTRQLYGIQVVT